MGTGYLVYIVIIAVISSISSLFYIPIYSCLSKATVTWYLVTGGGYIQVTA